MSPGTGETALQIAIQHHQAGRWAEAERGYRQVLAQAPDNPEALHLLGVLAGQVGRPDAAVELLTRAIRVNPSSATFHNSIGKVLAGSKRFEEAARHFARAIELAPDNPEGHNNLGIVLREQRRFAEANAALGRAIALRGDYAEAHYNLGNTLRDERRFEDACAAYRRAIELRPGLVEAWNNLAIALSDLDRVDEAIAVYRKVIELRPNFAKPYNNLGSGLRKAHRLDEALAALDRAIVLDPNYATAHANRGVVLHQLKRSDEALASFATAIRLAPEFADSHLHLGSALKDRGRTDEALAAYNRAIELRPDYAEAYCALGNLLKDQGRLDDALAAIRTAIRLKPDSPDAHSNLVLTMHYHPSFGAAEYFEECRRWSAEHAEPLKKFIRPHANSPDPDRRLRVGYVSPDFCAHVDSFFTIPLLSNLDRRQFEVFLYSDVPGPDPLTERIRGYADVWHVTLGLADEQLADLVRRDQIDILVDLKLHTAHNRLQMFARKPAPVQVSWLGYPGTTGLSTIDYRLTDPYLDPPGLLDACYSEQSIRLPETFWCYDPLIDQPPPVTGLPALEKGSITFGCLNNFCKINNGCLALWAGVLRAVPQSRLLLLAPPGAARERVLAKLQREGIAPPRVEFTEKRLRPDYLQLYNRIDLGLDPIPCNGHTTSLDAFWMGVPTVTLVSNTTAFGRAGWSQLSNLGLAELAADTPEQYVTVAARLAANLPRLQELRSTMRQRMLRSPLMDGKRFARHMEQAYRQMWHRWCGGRGGC